MLGAVVLITTALFAWSVIELANHSRLLEKIELNQYKMIEKAYELKQTSEDLTRFSRLYVITDNKKYKDIFLNILDIRNGSAPKPSNYNLLYWEVPEHVRKNKHPLSSPSSLVSEMKALPYLPSELEKLVEAVNFSNELVKLEEEAFYAVEGRFKDKSGNYSIIKARNQKLAISLLTSEKYQKAKEKIMLPIDEFLHSLTSRIQQEINQQRSEVTFAFNRLFILLFIAIAVYITTSFVVSRRILSPINYLTEVISFYRRNINVYEEKIFYQDEIGFMTSNFFNMKKELVDELKRLEFALNAGRQGWYELNPETQEILFSREYAKMLGYELAQYTKTISEWNECIHPDDLIKIQSTYAQELKSDNPAEHEYRQKNNDGEWVWLHSVAEVVERGSSGRATRIIGLNTDISVRKHHEFTEHTRAKVMELLIKTTPLKEILQTILEILDVDKDNIISSILLVDKDKNSLYSAAASNLPAFYNKAINGLKIGDGAGSCGTSAFTKKRIIVGDILKHPYWKDFKELAIKAKLSACWSEPIIGSNGEVLGTFAIYDSKPGTPTNQELKLLEFASSLASLAIEKSQADEQLLLSSHVFRDSHEGITITDTNGKILDVNPAFCNVTGYSRAEVIGKTPAILASGKQTKSFYQKMWESINEKDYWQGEVWNKKKTGELYAELLSISAIKDDEGKTLNYIGLFSDITKSKKQQEKLNLMAHYDLLTQLPNRVLFSDRFHQAIAHSKRTKSRLAVCFLDLDNFKLVNDTYGHQVGDQLLVEVAKRITRCLREEDSVSRQGGDEFALLINNLDSIQQCCFTIERILEELSLPFLIQGHTHRVSATCGITFYPEDNGEIDTLLRHADQAMYQAKLAGKNRYHLFNPEKDLQVIHLHSKLEEIDIAIDKDEFQLFYQPKVNMRTGKVYAAEALIRWIHPTKGLIPPLDFLPTVEGTEIEIKLGYWVINQALYQLSQWLDQGIELEVSINISSEHLLSSSFVSRLKQSLEKYTNVPPHLLELEVLESSALNDLESIGEIIKTCRYQLGVNVALDDFGTGYSSLAHLRNLSANTIKIDQSFVRDMLEDPSDYAIIEGVIGLSNSFDRKIIAEGVETTEHGLLLMLMGCDSAQGYGIAKPMPFTDFPNWLNNYKPNERWITFGDKTFSARQKKLKVFELTSIQWINHFTQNTLSPTSGVIFWPISDKTKCPCGTWLKRASKEGYFDDEWIASLNKRHNTLHLLADEIKEQYLHNQLDSYRNKLDRLNNCFEDMVQFMSESQKRFT